MGTSFSEIYDRFLGKIEDYPLLEQIEHDEEFVEDILHGYMISAISHFTYATKNLEERSSETKQFESKLTDLEIEILAMFMVYVYLSPYIISSDKIESVLTSKDFNNFSPANLMSQIKDIQRINYDRAVQLMVENHYRSGFIGD